MNKTNKHSLMKHRIFWMAIIAGAAVANLYYNQPLLATIAHSFNASTEQVGFIPMMTQIGYALGLLLFVPLGDLMERRRLIVTMIVATALALAAAAVSPNITWLIVVSLIIGMTTIVPQLIVPFAAFLTKPEERGKSVGIVMSGLFVGIVLARVISGFVGANLGWQQMYWIASGLMILVAVISAVMLPKTEPPNQCSYRELMQSLGGLIREHGVLRQAALIGAMSFGANSVFWSTLVFFLEQPPRNYGSEVAGMFGLLGIAGAIAALVAGRLADKKGPILMVGLGIGISISSFLIFWLLGDLLGCLVLGVILLEIGVQTTHISNQTRIYSLPLAAHSRLNTVYMVSYFVGGSMGSYLANYAWRTWQWNGVCSAGLLMLAVALTTFCWTSFFSKEKPTVVIAK